MRVLIIDDDPATTDILSLIMTQMGAETLVAHNGEEGLRITLEDNPDVILLDYMMPGMDGMQTCQAIRQFHQAPIMIISAVDDPYLVADLLNAGADDYLVKPISASMLKARIQNLINRPVFQPIPIRTCAPQELDR